MVVGRRPDEGTDIAAFKDQTRRTFRRIDGYLKAAGLTFDNVVMINSFHVWEGPNFSGGRAQQFKAFEEVKEEFMKGPKPAWTAVGVTALLLCGHRNRRSPGDRARSPSAAIGVGGVATRPSIEEQQDGRTRPAQ